MKLLTLIITFFSVFTSDYFAYSKPKLTIYTEEFPPFNYRDQEKITGGSTEIVEEIMKRANVDYSIKLLPWSRAYKLVQQDPNSLIYSISRRKDRENLFIWVGKIAPSNNSIYALKGSNIKISSLNDLNSFKIGTTFDDARDTYLIGKGIPRSQILRSHPIS